MPKNWCRVRKAEVCPLRKYTRPQSNLDIKRGPFLDENGSSGNLNPKKRNKGLSLGPIADSKIPENPTKMDLSLSDTPLPLPHQPESKYPKTSSPEIPKP